MKSRILMCITAVTLFGALVVPVQLSAQQHHHYKLVDMGTFGGPQSSVTDTGVPGSVFLNSRGMMTGYADLSTLDPYPNFCFIDCYIDHAFVWRDGFMTDMGVLPHGWSSAPIAISANGLIAGVDYTPPLLLRAGKTMGLGGIALYRHLILPASLPTYVAGLKQGWAFSWRSLMAGELLVIIAGSPSIGVLLDNAQSQLDMPSAMAIMIVILLLGIGVDAAFGAVDRSIRQRRGLSDAAGT